MEAFFNRYPDLPQEAILKTDLLRQGVAWTRAALAISAKAKPKSYFIFSFDRKTQAELTPEERRAAPEEFSLSGGQWNLKRTIVSQRMNPESPYIIDAREDGTLGLHCGEDWLCDVTLPRRPAYYDENLPSGKPVTDIAPTLEWGYLIYLTAFRLCQYWGKDEECQFCDINENYRQQKAEGRSYTGVKSPEEILAALEIINRLDTERLSTCYTVTGGSVTTQLNGLNEGEFYAQYARAIEEKFPGRWLGKAVVQGLPLDEVKVLKTAGYRIYHPNYEVWDKTIFNALCPGKARYVGRDEWVRRILDAAEIFGPQHVIPNFVAGIEMSRPHGFTDVEAAIRSTQEGLEFFMSRGVCPRFTVWCVEPNTGLHEANPEPPPLDYYCRLLQVYRETHHKYGLPVPPGYGEAGPGKAVFSVSAFMDVLG
jgi:hypothetical protein